jgi:acetyl esterase
VGTDSTPALGKPEGMRTEPDDALRAWVAALRASEPMAARMGAARLRLASRANAKGAAPGPELAVVEDHDLGDHFTARLYRPQLSTLPVVVYAHGGGFVMGDLDTHDRLARRLAYHAQVTVLSVDYRRAPEYRAPAAVEDVVRACQWADAMLGLLGGDERAGVGLAGDSAGGLLAAAAAVRLRDAARQGLAEPAGHLLLMTPNTDLTLTSASVAENGRGWGLERDDLQWYVEQWVPARADRFDPWVCPAYASLDGMPPAFVVTAEHDPLRDDGLWFAARLRAAGVPCEHLHYEDLVHGFFQLDQVSPALADAGDGALRRYGEFVRHLFALDED